MRPQQEGGLGLKTHRGKAVLVQTLALAAFALNLYFREPPLAYIGMAVGIGAFALAYSNRGAANPWANTHHEHALRTVIIGYSIWTLGSLLGYVHGALGVGTIYIHFAIAAWAILRSVIGVVLAMLRKPIPNPRGWFI